MARFRRRHSLPFDGSRLRCFQSQFPLACEEGGTAFEHAQLPGTASASSLGCFRRRLISAQGSGGPVGLAAGGLAHSGRRRGSPGPRPGQREPHRDSHRTSAPALPPRGCMSPPTHTSQQVLTVRNLPWLPGTLRLGCSPEALLGEPLQPSCWPTRPEPLPGPRQAPLLGGNPS